MSTLRDALNAAARKIGINQQNEVLTGENLTVTQYALQNLVDYFSNNSLLVYKRSEFIFPLTGQKQYTLGMGGDWNIPRPMKIDTFTTVLNPGSIQELVIQVQPLTYEQYALISVPNTSSQFPFAYYDDNNYPLRTITLFPVPSGPASVRIWCREPLIDLQQNTIWYLVEPFQGGSGYPDGFYQNIKLGGGSGNGAQADITVLDGAVTSCVLKDGGTGYAVNDVLYISPISIGNNVLSSISINTAGSGYTDGTSSEVPILSETGIGASVNITVAGGEVTEVSIYNAGEGFTTGNTFTLVGQSGTGFVGNIDSVSSATTGSGFAIKVGAVSANLDNPIGYPPGYEYFFILRLAEYLALEFGKTVPQSLLVQADKAQKELERMNYVPGFVRGDGGMRRSGRNRNFNYITGNFVNWMMGN